MEGRPRNQERPEDSEDENSESNKKKKRRFRPPLSSYLEKPKESSEDEGKSWWPKFERINKRKDARPLIPEMRPVETEQLDEAVETADQDITNRDQVEPVTQSEDETVPAFETTDSDMQDHREESIDLPETADPQPTESYSLPDVQPESLDQTEEAQEEDPQTNLRAEASQQSIESQVEDLDSDIDTDESHTSEAEAETPPIPEPESLEEILRRSRRERYVTPIVERTEPSENTTSITNINTYETHNHYTNPNTGLHLLNYALARRRDARDRHAAERKFNTVNRRIDSLESVQKQSPSVEKLSEKRQKSINDTPPAATVFDRSKEVITNNEDKKTTDIVENTIFESPRSLDTKKYIQMDTLALTPEQQPGIVSEAQYERRHEVKDISREGQQNTGLNSMSQTSNNLFGDAQQTYSSTAGTPKTSNISDPYQSPTSKNDVSYKEAAITGAWGAIVGLLLFIIFYMLTRG